MAVGSSVVGVRASNYSRNLDKVFDEAQLTGELKLCGRKLKEYPKSSSKYNLGDVVIADLSKNRLSELPPEICEYRSLEKLHLYHNAIKTLAEPLACLQYLTHLILSRNQLSVLPSCVCHLASLKVLDVSGNRLVSLPEELGILSNLTELDASYNQLQHLPPSLGDLDELRRLELRRNLLQQVPTEICFLHLTLLDLSYNRIASLPTELRFMSTLLTLLLDANPLTHPPAHVCTRGRVHIFKWLDQAAAKEDKKRTLSEVEFRKTRKHTAAVPPVVDFRFVNGFLDGRHKRSTVDSGYSTSENGDNRWSHGSQEQLFEPLRAAEATKEQRQDRIHRPHLNGSAFPLTNGVSSAAPLDGYAYNRSHSYSSGSLTEQVSNPSTPSTLSPGESFNLEDEFHKAMKIRQEMGANFNDQISDGKTSHNRADAGGPLPPSSLNGGKDGACLTSSASSGTHHLRYPPSTDPSLPHNPDPGGGGPPSFVPSPQSPHAHVRTYREYLEAKRQQRALDSNNIYKRQCSENLSPSEQSSPQGLEELGHSSPLHSSRNSLRATTNGAHPSNGSHPRTPEDSTRDLNRATVKSIQKEAVLSYVKSRVSPTKSMSPGSPNTSFDSSDGSTFPYSSQVSHHTNNPPYPSSPLHSYATTSTPYAGTNGSAFPSNSKASPILGTPPSHPLYPNRSRSVPSGSPSDTLPNIVKSRKKSGGGKPFEPDLTPRLNFTYRRELEKQQHEKQLIDNLRDIIETRLKVSLPSELSSALMDGVVLCHLVNHVRPRAVSSIHVPSPAVPKLTIAKCRLNVENFLEACRRIGVEEASLCSCDDLVTHFDPERVLTTVRSLLLSPPEALLISDGSRPTAASSESPPKDSMTSIPFSFSSSCPRSSPTSSSSELVPCVNAGSPCGQEGEPLQGMVAARSSLPPELTATSERDRAVSIVLLCVFLVTVVFLAFYPLGEQNEI